MIKKYLLAGLITSLISVSAHALSLQDAKSSGLIGELGNGYIGSVKQDEKKPSKAVITLVEEVNEKRRVRFKQIASKNAVSIDAVAARAGKKFLDKTKKGHYVKDNKGAWLKK